MQKEATATKTSKPPKHKTKWIAKGRTYSKLKPGSQPNKPDKDILIPEAPPEINMEGEKIFGEPIDAKLAVHYIRKLWTEILDDEVLTIHQKVEQYLTDMKKKAASSAVASKKASNGKETIDLSKKIYDECEKAVHWIIKLLESSFAITMDKSVLLKTLSQPECVGVRFYLCMKEKNGDINSRDRDNLKLTLLTVGIDNKGTDLHFDREKSSIMEHDVIPDIETESLCTEYPRTPDMIETQGISSADLRPYVLFRYAMNKDVMTYMQTSKKSLRVNK